MIYLPTCTMYIYHPCREIYHFPMDPMGICVYPLNTRWWFQIFCFSPLFGEDSHFDEYFSDGWFNHQPE